MTARFPQLIPIVNLVLWILGVIAIIWHQNHLVDSLIHDLRADSAEWRAERNRSETTPKAEFNHVETAMRADRTAEIDSVETDLRDEIRRMRAEIKGVESTLRGEIGELRGEVKGVETTLLDEVVANGERLARIEGFLGIGTPDTATERGLG